MQSISPRRMRLALSLLLICFLERSLPVTAASAPRLADPFRDPKDDPYNPLGYITSNVLTGIALSLVLAVAILQTFSMLKWGAQWMVCMVIGAYTLAIGIGCRFGLHVKPESRGIYIMEHFLVTLSPCAFVAADYILLGRLARYLGSGSEKHIMMAPNRITITFIISDVITFLIQSTGGAISMGANTTKGVKLGFEIFLGGLFIQVISFLVFTTVFLRFVYRVHKFERKAWMFHHGNRWYSDWRTLAVALGISCAGIIIRSFYRVVELLQGYRGPIEQNEDLFYGLDILPLFVAISVYVPFWPGRIIPQGSGVVPDVADGSTSAELEKKDAATEREDGVNVA